MSALCLTIHFRLRHVTEECAFRRSSSNNYMVMQNTSRTYSSVARASYNHLNRYL